MNRKSLVAGLGLAFFLSSISGLALAEDEPGPFMISLIEMNIKTGHERQVMDGIAAWKACYLENDGESQWNIWRRMHGDGAAVVASFTMANWAELDRQDAAGQACQEIATKQIMAHTRSSSRSFLRFMPEQSRELGEIANVIWVTRFRVKDGRKFRSVIDTATGAMRNVEGQPRGIWYNVMGGSPKSAHYMVVAPLDNFAALDEDRDDVWKIVETDQGEQAANRLRADFMESVDSVWSYLYRRNSELSHWSAD